MTALLRDWRAGDRTAEEALMARVYDDLRRVAVRHLRAERPGHTFRPTELVSEAYLRLAAGEQPEWNDRVHFFAIAARTMRQILVDHARKRRADKRGAGAKVITFDDAKIEVDRPDVVVALDDALVELAKHDERKARAVELNYFGGLTQAEIAEVLGVHVNTVAKDLKIAEAWLHRELLRR